MTKRKLVFANNPLLSGPKLEEREKGGIPYRELPINVIDRDPNQPRVNFDEEKLAELCSSIKTYGVLSPILVRPAKVLGRYSLISGERRLKASTLAGLTVIPALIDQSTDQSGERTLAMQLVENLQRSDLSPLERAHAIGALKETFNLSVRDVAERLGISKSMVQRSLDILELPDDLLNALREGASESKVLLLAKIEDADIRASYLKDLDVLTRRDLKKGVDGAVSANNDDRQTTSPEDERIIDELQKALGLKVKLVRNQGQTETGRLSVDFYSAEDLQLVFRRLVSE